MHVVRHTESDCTTRIPDTRIPGLGPCALWTQIKADLHPHTSSSAFIPFNPFMGTKATFKHFAFVIRSWCTFYVPTILETSSKVAFTYLQVIQAGGVGSQWMTWILQDSMSVSAQPKFTHSFRFHICWWLDVDEIHFHLYFRCVGCFK